MDEVVSHFLLSRSDFSANNGRVKYRALEPSKTENSISVFRVSNLTENEIWDLGQQHVVPDGKSLHARADLIVENIISATLSIAPDEPPVRHANVFHWPTQKDAIMAIALELAAQAVLKLPLNP